MIAYRPLQGRRRVTGDTATHAAYGVGPATDLGADIGDPLFAPFAGTVSTWYSPPGGNTTRITHDTIDLAAFIQHQNDYTPNVLDGRCAQLEHIGYAGNTGSMSAGPHVHCWIQYNGVRISFEHFMGITGGTETPLGDLTPLPPAMADVDATLTPANTGDIMHAIRKTDQKDSGIIMRDSSAPSSLPDKVFSAECGSYGLTVRTLPGWQYDTAVREAWLAFNRDTALVAKAVAAALQK